MGAQAECFAVDLVAPCTSLLVSTPSGIKTMAPPSWLSGALAGAAAGFGAGALLMWASKTSTKIAASKLKCINVEGNAPKPIGPYCSAVQMGNILFCSGQVAL